MKNTIVLCGGTVVDVREGSLSPNTNIVIGGTKIVRIERSQSEPEPGVVAIDCRGKFVVPGFWDMHVHSMQDPHPEDSLAVLLAYGITGVRQMAGSSKLLALRAQGDLAHGLDTPELLAMPGEILSGATGDTPESAVAEVRKQKAEGADFIKTVFVTPKAFFASLAEANRQGLPYGGHLSPGVDVAKASKSGMRFIEHLGPTEMLLIKCSKAEILIRAVLALRPPAPLKITTEELEGMIGQMMIANPILFRLSIDPKGMEKTQQLINSYQEEKGRRLAAVFAENNTWHCPTLIRNETMQFGDEPRFTESPDLRYVPVALKDIWAEVARQYAEKLTPRSRDTMKRLMDLSFRIVKTLDEGGVPMLAGSDYGGGWVIPGVSLHQEFDLLAQAGLSALKVLQMTTINAARFLHREATGGTVEEGKDANLVLLDKNPLESVQNLHTLFAVIRDGRHYSTDDLMLLKERVATRIK